MSERDSETEFWVSLIGAMSENKAEKEKNQNKNKKKTKNN